MTDKEDWLENELNQIFSKKAKKAKKAKSDDPVQFRRDAIKALHRATDKWLAEWNDIISSG